MFKKWVKMVSILLKFSNVRMQVILECKQKELEEMGIPKGHALKIAIHIKKSSAESNPNKKQNNNRESTH